MKRTIHAMIDDLRTQIQQRIATQRTMLTQQPHAAPPEPPRQIGLALGGGGGRGAAHLGVLAALEELELPIDLIAGTSIGGAIGILYAAGLSIEEISQQFPNFALHRIAASDPTRTGLIGARRREAMLQRLLGTRTFDDLRIPCAVTSADLATGKLVVIDRGPLVEAIMATTAIPGIFPPVIRESEILVDGGVLNNVPVDIVKQMGAQRVVAVQLSAGMDQFDFPTTAPTNFLKQLVVPPRQLASAGRALDLLIAEATELRLAQHPDALCLRPPVMEISMLDMTRVTDGYDAGVQVAHSARAELLDLRAWRQPPEPAAPPAAPEPHPRRWHLFGQPSDTAQVRQGHLS